MDNTNLLEQIERYLNNEMNAEEKNAFENLRATSPDVDMAVVEHRFFLNRLQEFGIKKDLKQNLQNVHNELIAEGKIQEYNAPKQGKVVAFFNKYKRTAGIAASIAGITTLLISALFSLYSPKKNDAKIEQLNREINQIKKTQNYQGIKLQEVDSKIPEGSYIASGGSAFLIDNKGFLITCAHVLKGSGAVVVDNEGKEYNTKIVHVDNAKDLAVLQIQDKDYVPVNPLPYSLKQKNPDLGEEIFIMGYPRNEITYNSGYISAKTGYDGDTSTFQMTLLANPGNSGGPVFNKKGEVIGLLSTRQAKTEGIKFAIKSDEIFKVMKQWKSSDTSAVRNLSIMSKNTAVTDNRVDMLKSYDDYIFMVKVYN